ncbi:hypothetical protein O3Q51_17015 [Cryomorphaceae bacterium 1068]|nr:hypothetical protein [Cryomorphaceae bacterium 1068]
MQIDRERRIFPEDWVLYILTLLATGFAYHYLSEAKEKQLDLIEMAYQDEISTDIKFDKSDRIEVAYFKAQVQQTNRIAGHSSRGLVASSSIKFVGFLIGVVMVFLGSIMIIRGIRNMPTVVDGSLNDQAKISIISSSPGVIYSVLGVVVILSTVLSTSNIGFTVNPIIPYNLFQAEIEDNDNQQQDTTNTKPFENENLYK